MSDVWKSMEILFLSRIMDKEKAIEELAHDLSRKWYEDGYGGYHWSTADEIVEEFILWLYKNGGEINE